MVALAVGCGPDEPPPRSNRLNLLVFLLDAARADHFGCYGYERDTTPNIDALAREGVVYETVVAEAASTFASTAAFMTGSSPAESGLLQTTEIPLALKTLGQRATAAGYRTYGYSENPFITSKFGFDRGFEEFVEVFLHALFAELGSPPPAHLEPREPGASSGAIQSPKTSWAPNAPPNAVLIGVGISSSCGPQLCASAWRCFYWPRGRLVTFCARPAMPAAPRPWQRCRVMKSVPVTGSRATTAPPAIP
ncbi:MAG: hypothetical protein E2O66_00235 [Deltaproteobacteria bacterium]|nr:MAG: hypothetical protein E2O66_00235 [Deltaproteobacteria bacterium]